MVVQNDSHRRRMPVSKEAAAGLVKELVRPVESRFNRLVDAGYLVAASRQVSALNFTDAQIETYKPKALEGGARLLMDGYYELALQVFSAFKVPKHDVEPYALDAAVYLTSIGKVDVAIKTLSAFQVPEKKARPALLKGIGKALRRDMPLLAADSAHAITLTIKEANWFKPRVALLIESMAKTGAVVEVPRVASAFFFTEAQLRTALAATKRE